MELLLKQNHAVFYLNDSTTTELLYGGGAGGGKSALGVLWLIQQCQKYPQTRWLMGRAKLKALKETTLNTFFQQTSDLGLNNQYKYNSQTNVITWSNGSEILLKDLFLYPSDPNFDSLGSLEITGAFVDECNQCTEKAVQIVKSRMRYKLKKYNLIPKLLMTCNPAKNWTYSNFYNPSLNGTLLPHRKFIQALPIDNPHLPESYIETLRSLDTASRKRLLEGDWNFDDNPYAMFEYSDILGMFTSEWVKPTQERYMTADIAYTGSDKFVIVIWHGLVAVKIIAIDKIDDTMISKKINELRIEHRVPIKNVIYDSDGLQTFTRFSSKFGILSGATGFKNNGKAIKVAGKVENFRNLKAQCYFYFADLVKDCKVLIQDKTYNKQIIEEFEQINRKPLDDDGLISMERKADVKERLKRSPDFADAIMMRAYAEVKGKVKPRIFW
jgi:PBSX family phage terminase large subunit